PLRSEEDHHPVPALLQYARERISAVRRAFQGAAPQRGDRAAGRRRQAQAGRGAAGGAGHLPRLVLPGAPQRHQRGAAAGADLDRGQGEGDGPQSHGAVLLRRGRRPGEGSMKRLVVVTAAAAGLACTSLSTVQTASPVGAGKTRIAIAPQVTTFTPPTGGPFGGGPNASTAVVVPNLELAARFGLS